MKQHIHAGNGAFPCIEEMVQIRVVHTFADHAYHVVPEQVAQALTFGIPCCIAQEDWHRYLIIGWQKGFYLERETHKNGK